MTKSKPAGKRKTRKTVTVTATQARRLKRSKQELRRIRAAAKRRGKADASDPPPITQADLDAGRARIVRRAPAPAKVSLTLRLDEDLVEAFRSGGKGYQTRINDALRSYLALAAEDDPATAAEAFARIEALLAQLKRRVQREDAA